MQTSKALIIGFDTPAIIQTSCEPLENLVETRAARHSPAARDLRRAPHPWESTRTVVVGLLPVGTACAFSGRLRGLRLVPAKWRCLIPPTSTPEGAYPQGATQTRAVRRDQDFPNR